jgi:hypothetical protein
MVILGRKKQREIRYARTRPIVTSRTLFLFKSDDAGSSNGTLFKQLPVKDPKSSPNFRVFKKPFFPLIFLFNLILLIFPFLSLSKMAIDFFLQLTEIRILTKIFPPKKMSLILYKYTSSSCLIFCRFQSCFSQHKQYRPCVQWS